MDIKGLNDKESVIIAIMGTLLLNKRTSADIKQFIDDSKDISLENNEIILETPLKKFKIRVDEVNS